MCDRGEGEVDTSEPDAPFREVFQIQEAAAFYLNVRALDTNTPIENCNEGAESKEAISVAGELATLKAIGSFVCSLEWSVFPGPFVELLEVCEFLFSGPLLLPIRQLFSHIGRLRHDYIGSIFHYYYLDSIPKLNI